MTSKTSLQQAFDFTIDDLAANQKGLLSDRQMETGLPSIRRFLFGTTAGMALLLSVAVIYAGITVDSRMGFWLGILSVGAVWGYWRNQYKIYRLAVDDFTFVEKGQLKHFDHFSKRNIVIFNEDTPFQKAIPVDGAKLYLTDEEYTALDNEGYYRVFYWHWRDANEKPQAYILSVEDLH